MVRQHADRLEFEEAARYQEKIKHLQEYQSRSAVVNAKTGTVDAFSILEEGDTAYVHYMAVNHGTIIHTKTITLQKAGRNTGRSPAVFHCPLKGPFQQQKAEEIILPFEIDYPDGHVQITVPRSGDKKTAGSLRKNVQYFKTELDERKMLRLEDKSSDEKNGSSGTVTTRPVFTGPAEHIECFDNSNLHGTNAVAAMVCFRNGEPASRTTVNSILKPYRASMILPLWKKWFSGDINA